MTNKPLEAAPAPNTAGLATEPAPKPRKKLIAIIAAAALVVGGSVTAVVLGSQAAYAAETDKLCTTALAATNVVQATAKSTIAEADAALKAVESTKLPKDGGTSTAYAKWPAVKPVEAAESQKPTAPTLEVKEVTARPSGADLIKAVADAKLALTEHDAPSSCADRDDVKQLTAGAKQLDTLSTALDEHTQLLLADFAVFQKDEAARIAAEKAAAEKAAAEEAARVAAEQAAAQAAAEQAAAEQAAWEAQQQQYYAPQQNYIPPQNNGGGGGGGGWDGGGGGGGGSGGTIILPPGGGGGCSEGWVCYG